MSSPLVDGEIGETVFTAAHHPDPGSARDVLAFVLTPTRLFAGEGDEAVEMINAAKAEAVRRWCELQP